ncbi:MAG: hypothetical protein ACM3PP_04290 [Candidatus Saccharibacteria bacterium]
MEVDSGMNIKNALAILLIAAMIPLGLAGCGQKSGNQTGTPSGNQAGTTQTKPKPPKPQVKVVKTADQFISQYKSWTSRLEGIASKNDKLFSDWSKGDVKRNKFNDNVDTIKNEVEKINNEVDLKTDFKLSTSAKQKVKYEQVSKAYNRTAKDLNDFLYVAPHLQDKDLKTSYQQMIQRDFKNHLAELKGLLNSVK